LAVAVNPLCVVSTPPATPWPWRGASSSGFDVTEYGLRDGTEEPRTPTKKTGASFDSFKFLNEYKTKKLNVKNSQFVHKLGNKIKDNNQAKHAKVKPLESAEKAIYHEEQNKLSENTSCKNSISEEGQTAPGGPFTDSSTPHQHSLQPIVIEGGQEQVGHPIKPSGQSTRDPNNPVDKPKQDGKICAFDKNQSVHTKIHAVDLEDHTVTKYFATTPKAKATTDEQDSIEIIEVRDDYDAAVVEHQQPAVINEHQNVAVYAAHLNSAVISEQQNPAVNAKLQNPAFNTEHQHPCVNTEQSPANNIEHLNSADNNTDHQYPSIITKQQDPAEQQSAWPEQAYYYNGPPYIPADYIIVAPYSEGSVAPYTEGYEDDPNNVGYRETTYFLPDNGGDIYQVETAPTSYSNGAAYNYPVETNPSNSLPNMNTENKAKLDLDAWMQQNCRVTAKEPSPTTYPNNNPGNNYKNWIAQTFNKPTDIIQASAPVKKRCSIKVPVSKADRAKAELYSIAANNEKGCLGPAADSLKLQNEALALPSDQEDPPRPLSSDTGYFSHKETASSSSTPLPSPPHSPTYPALDNKDIKPVEKTICPPITVAEPPFKKSRFNFNLENGTTRTDEAGRWVVTTLGTTKGRGTTAADTELVKIGCVEMKDLHLEPESSIKTAMKKSARGRTKKKQLEVISRNKDVVFIEPKQKENRKEIRSIKHLAEVTRRFYQDKSLRQELSMQRTRNMQLKARVVELKGLLDANMKNYMSAIATGDLVWTNPTPFIAS